MIEVVIERFKEEKRHLFASNGRYDYERAFELLVEVVGEGAPLNRVDKTAIRSVKKILETLPKRARNSPVNKDKTYRQLSQQGRENDDADGLSSKRQNTLLGCISAFMLWAVNQGYAEQNPVSGMFLDQGPKKSDRMPFDKEQLERIFHAPVYTGCESAHFWLRPGACLIKDSSYWLPLLALFTGARSNELLQLTRESLKATDGCHYIEIRGQLKTKASKRDVPLHSALSECGFVEWVKSQKAGERLFRAVFDLYESFWDSHRA